MGKQTNTDIQLSQFPKTCIYNTGAYAHAGLLWHYILGKVNLRKVSLSILIIYNQQNIKEPHKVFMDENRLTNQDDAGETKPYQLMVKFW